MITTLGKQHILRRNCGIVNSLADTILLGVSNTAESVNDVRLSHEFLRIAVDSVYPDIDNGLVIFKCVVPSEIVGKIYEVGLLSKSSIDVDNFYDHLITSFGQNEFWSSGSLITTGSRAGGTMLRLTANATTNVDYDFSYYLNEDRFVLALNSSTSTSIKIKFGPNDQNYFVKTISLVSGYQFVTADKGSFTTTGNPTWNDINYFAIEVSSATVDFDSLRVQKKNIIDPTYVLVSRKVLSSPIDKIAGSEKELEYSLKLT